jgi:hypothetical protein
MFLSRKSASPRRLVARPGSQRPIPGRHRPEQYQRFEIVVEKGAPTTQHDQGAIPRDIGGRRAHRAAAIPGDASENVPAQFILGRLWAQ